MKTNCPKYEESQKMLAQDKKKQIKVLHNPVLNILVVAEPFTYITDCILNRYIER